MKKYFIGIALTFCCIAVYGNLYDKFLIPRFVLASLSLLIIFLFVIISRRTLRIPKSNTFYLYLGFVILTGLSIIWSTNLGEAVFQVCQYLMGLMVCIVFYDFLTNEYQVAKKVLWVSAVIILTIYLLFAIIQLFGLKDTSFVQLYAVTGINAHKNLLSIMLFMISAFLLTALPEINSKFLKAFFLTLFGISILMIVFLKSRAVILSLIISIIVFFIIYFLHVRKPVCSKCFKTTTAIIGTVLTFLFFTVLIRYYSSIMASHTYEKSEEQTSITSTSSLVERFTLWDKTYHVVDEYPLGGCGAGNWQICFPDAGLTGLNRVDYWNISFTKPHNEYLGILAENGYIGLFLYLTFLCFLVVSSGFSIIETKDEKEFYFGLITLCIVCGCCVNVSFNFSNSRIEHLVWMGILYAILFRFVTKKREVSEIGSHVWIGIFFFLILTAFMVMVGIIRFKGERETMEMQLALRHNDWKNVEQFSDKAISRLYTVDPVGMPLHWYHGQSLKAMNSPLSIYSFRKAFNNAPFCKENLNDLGVDEYNIADNPERAKFLLREAIRISPNYLYPYFNLISIYLTENKFREAKEVSDMIELDEQKCAFLKEEAHIFEPYNIDAEKQRIEVDYQTVILLRHVLDSLLPPF